jgi:AcrR family transcriptional regulator
VAANPKANRGPSAGPENRQALIDAAREIFAESGAHAPLSAVARRAGVGQGSLYRHFPDRLALAVAVFDDNIEHLEALVANPNATLEDLFDATTEQALGSTALIELFTLERNDPRALRFGTRVMAVVTAILNRDKAAGRISDHVEPDDVMVSVSMLSVLLSRTDAADRPAVVARARTIFRNSFAARLDAQES